MDRRNAPDVISMEAAKVKGMRSSHAQHPRLGSGLEARNAARGSNRRPRQKAHPKALIHHTLSSQLVGKDLAGHLGGCQSDAFARVADLYQCTFRAL